LVVKGKTNNISANLTSPRKKAHHAKISDHSNIHNHNTKTPDSSSRIKAAIRAKTPAVVPLFKTDVVTSNGPITFKGTLPRELKDTYYPKAFIGKGACGQVITADIK
jgi:hypothetical protein